MNKLLFSLAVLVVAGCSLSTVDGECLKEQCAESTGMILEILKNLEDKMPADMARLMKEGKFMEAIRDPENCDWGAMWRAAKNSFEMCKNDTLEMKQKKIEEYKTFKDELMKNLMVMHDSEEAKKCRNGIHEMKKDIMDKYVKC